MAISCPTRGAWLALLLVLLCPTAAGAQSFTLAWDASADAAGYVVKWGTAPDAYATSVDAGPGTSLAIDSFVPGTRYWIVVEAYNDEGVFSDPSTPLEFLACTFSVTPAASIGPEGGLVDAAVTTQAGCPWSPQLNAVSMWVSGTSAPTGSGIATFQVRPNYSTRARTIVATIEGQTFAVEQAGAPVDLPLQAREHARADLNGDGFNDLFWQDLSTGYLATWQLQGGVATWTPASLSHRVLDSNWRIVGTGDFNGDGKPDIVWHHRLTGSLYLWYMDGATRIGQTSFSLDGIPDPRWKVVGIGDFNGDRKPDLVWQHDTGWLAVWMMDGATLIGGVDLTPMKVLDTNWRITGVADLNADGQSDLIFRHTASGEIAGWLMNGTTRASYQPFAPGAIVDKNWRLAAVLDMDGDQTPDFVWHHEVNGGIAVWFMNGTIRTSFQSFAVATQPGWKIAGPK